MSGCCIHDFYISIKSSKPTFNLLKTIISSLLLSGIKWHNQLAELRRLLSGARDAFLALHLLDMAGLKMPDYYHGDSFF